ncbi:MAG: hypothetical protein LBS61_04115 [Endomicrobium sp.]|jgi:hypothetical protein|nr:hypothetical protein [Endomicrobium sp.]
MIAPATGQYFVNPESMAFIAAFFMFCGASKSGSPTPKLITSIPCRFKAFAFASMASVGDSLMDCALFETFASRSF